MRFLVKLIIFFLNNRLNKKLDLRGVYEQIGIVEGIGDGIINILGLKDVFNREMVEIFIQKKNLKVKKISINEIL